MEPSRLARRLSFFLDIVYGSVFYLPTFCRTMVAENILLIMMHTHSHTWWAWVEYSICTGQDPGEWTKLTPPGECSTLWPCLHPFIKCIACNLIKKKNWKMHPSSLTTLTFLRWRCSMANSSCPPGETWNSRQCRCVGTTSNVRHSPSSPPLTSPRPQQHPGTCRDIYL